MDKQNQLARILWDDVVIARESATMPEALREPYRWFKCWARDTCLRDVDTVTIRLRELGIDRDRSTWSKLLRGKYCIDDKGNVRTALINQEKLIEEIESVQRNQRIESMRGKIPFVATSVWETIRTAIDIRSTPERVNKWCIISGYTGSGKSACLNEYKLQRNHGRTKKIEAPENATFSELLHLIARECGKSIHGNMSSMRAKILESFSAGNSKERASRILIVDNAQELWDTKKDSKQPSFTFLRRLQDETGCTIVLSITPLFERKLIEGMIQGWFEQIEGRSGGRKNWIRLPEYPPEEDCVAIAKMFGMIDANQKSKSLTTIAREPGRIRRLFEDLQNGKTLAGKDPFTFDHVALAREGDTTEEGQE